MMRLLFLIIPSRDQRERTRLEYPPTQSNAQHPHHRYNQCLRIAENT